MDIPYDSFFWEKLLFSTLPNRCYWVVKCHKCQDGQKCVPLKSLNNVTTLRQWERVVINKKKQSDESNETAQQGMDSQPLACSTTVIKCLLGKH